MACSSDQRCIVRMGLVGQKVRRLEGESIEHRVEDQKSEVRG
jgi:hypothetical protein